MPDAPERRRRHRRVADCDGGEDTGRAGGSREAPSAGPEPTTDELADLVESVTSRSNPPGASGTSRTQALLLRQLLGEAATRQALEAIADALDDLVDDLAAVHKLLDDRGRPVKLGPIVVERRDLPMVLALGLALATLLVVSGLDPRDLIPWRREGPATAPVPTGRE